MARKTAYSEAEFDADLQFCFPRGETAEALRDRSRRDSAIAALIKDREALRNDIAGIRDVIATVTELAPPMRAQYRRHVKALERIVAALDVVAARPDGQAKG